MSENNGSKKEQPAHRQLFPTKEQAEANRPGEEVKTLRLFEVKKGEAVLGYTWTASAEGAVALAAKQDGYSAGVADPKAGGPITKEKVAQKLAEFSDEELKALGLSRKKTK